VLISVLSDANEKSRLWRAACANIRACREKVNKLRVKRQLGLSRYNFATVAMLMHLDSQVGENPKKPVMTGG
jgi:hypothetical protein